MESTPRRIDCLSGWPFFGFRLHAKIQPRARPPFQEAPDPSRIAKTQGLIQKQSSKDGGKKAVIKGGAFFSSKAESTALKKALCGIKKMQISQNHISPRLVAGHEFLLSSWARHGQHRLLPLQPRFRQGRRLLALRLARHRRRDLNLTPEKDAISDPGCVEGPTGPWVKTPYPQ